MLTAAVVGAKLEAYTPVSAMSAEQLTAFWAAVEVDEGLQEKLKGARDADAVVAIAEGAGFVISAEELQSEAERELSDDELEAWLGATDVPCLGWGLQTAEAPNSTRLGKGGLRRPACLIPPSPCYRRGFLILQSLPKHLKRPPIPGTIFRLYRRY